NTEVYGSLNSLSNQTEIYKNLDLYFQKADKKYNSGLYKIETWLSNLVIEDRVLKGIIKGLYYPAPYEFSVLPIEILGNIYEQFLGKTIRLTEGHQAKVEYKPEVRKAGGVYYTPEYIVSYIVKNTVGALLQPTTSDMSSQPTTSVVGKTPEEISELKILDPACGSGSFLVNAYSYLLDYHTEYYSNESNRNKALKGNKIYQVDDKTFHLTIEEKQKILLNNIYGVDIDSQAVETTKLSLLLKLMEGEILESAGELFKHSQKALLPDLKNNIKCGNSLIGSDFYDDKDMSLFGNDEIRKINTFDWEKEFPEIIGRNEISKFHHITFATKYSRSPVPVDYDILDDEQIPILIDCFKETKDKFGVKILACAVLPEHIHLIIADMGNKITEIVKHLKGYSAMVLNRRFKSSVEGGGQQHNLWAKSFDDTFILDEKHLFNAIEYVNNNYLKHSDKWKIPSQVVQDKIKELVSPFTKWKDYEYNTGGFDCVIGNPPYVKYENLDNSLKNYAKIRYSCTESFFDIFQLFLEKSYFLINQNGLLGFIIPNLFLKGMNYKSSRHFFFENSKILIIRNYGDGVFHNVKMPTCICVFEKSNNKNKSIKYYEIKDEGTKLLEINQNNFNNQNYIFKSDIITEILNQKFIPLENYIEISRGLEIGKDKIINRNKSSIKILFGEDISRYVIKSESYIDKNIYEKFNKNVEIFKNEKIVIRETGTKLFVIYDNDGYITNRSLYCIRSKKINLKFLIGVLNSKLIQYYYENEFKSETEIFPKIRIGQVKKIPIPKIITQHQPTTDNIITLVDQMLTAQKEYHAPSTDDLSRRLIKQKIDAIDRQIDNLVYKLYDLTDEEIRIVEEGI
ncbi:MAG: N-6 DNA methylase, partial [Ignavibacteriales bacterium]|nr:N-6 DNA methylase [Ignavibacteriales bacterium]